MNSQQFIEEIKKNDYLTENQKKQELIWYNICPECGSKLIRESGCATCLICGWSACG
ncbi:MAG: hypothetical protein ACOC80_07545 [Petrotogales bacterium]